MSKLFPRFSTHLFFLLLFTFIHSSCGCASNEYDDGNGNCYSCGGCASCWYYGYCTSCYSGAFLSGSSCYSCSSGCTACASSASNCASCNSDWFLVGTTCYACSSNCATCGSTASTCLTCNSGWFLVGTTCSACSNNCLTCVTTASTCTSCNTDWFMVGTTCYPTCSSPLYSNVVSGITYCNTPCPGQYAYWDGSCGSTCSYSSSYETFSVTLSNENTFLRCDFPCGTNQFLSWNNTCLNTCPEPLTALPYKSRNFCSFPCSDTTQYLYWDKSCKSTCPPPLLSEIQGSPMQRKFYWLPCPSGQLLLSDGSGSCIDSCPSGYYEETYSCEPCQDFLCSVCGASSSGTICQQCKDPYILNSNSVCQGKSYYFSHLFLFLKRLPSPKQ